MSEAATIAEPVVQANAPAPSPAPSPSPSPAAPAPSLLAKGAAPSPAPATDTPPASPIPAKYHVKKDDGSIDEAASLAKWGEGHKNLEQRLGTGEAPPAKPEDYSLSLPPEVSLDTLKADPHFSGFLKGAHARGMTNAQVSYVIESYQARMSMAASPEAGEAELRKVWTTDEQMQRGLSDAYRAQAAFAGADADRAARLEAKFGNDPDFLFVMAQVGKELHEDSPITGALTPSESDSLDSLLKHPAYFDHKHPEHDKVVRQAKGLYEKKTGGR